MVKASLSVDVNKLVDFMKSGDAEEGERKFFNDWEARDQYARQQGTFDYGRRSEEATGLLGIVIGRKYYAVSALAALERGIELDSERKYRQLWNTYK